MSYLEQLRRQKQLEYYQTKKEAKLHIGEQVIENRERLKEAQNKYYSPLGSDLKPLELRSDVPTRVEVDGNIYETKSITQYAEGKAKSIGLSNPPAKNLESDDLPGLKMTSDEYRTYNSTGMYGGQFRNPFVLDQASELDKAKAWPEGKSLKGFLKAMSYGWNTIADREAKYVQKRESLEIHRGHGRSVEQGGSNWWTNVAPQFAKATDPDDPDLGIEGPKRQAANLAIGKHSLKELDDLEMAGNYGVDVKKAFNAYLMEGDKGVLDLSRFSTEARTRILHGTERTAEGQVAEEELNLRKTEHNKLIAEANKGGAPPLAKAKTPKDLFFNSIRTTARIAGQSPNPLANIAGDIVGAVMDTAVYIANPNDPDALTDLTLSGSQALISVGSTALAFVPIPGARPGAYALMKVGDNIGKVERIWNMTREGRMLARQMKAGKTPTLQKKKPTIISKQSGQEVAEMRKDIQIDNRVNRNLLRMRR
jgi:hypothetical protein